LALFHQVAAIFPITNMTRTSMASSNRHYPNRNGNTGDWDIEPAFLLPLEVVLSYSHNSLQYRCYRRRLFVWAMTKGINH
jgi:hypothetical protein